MSVCAIGEVLVEEVALGGIGDDEQSVTSGMIVLWGVEAKSGVELKEYELLFTDITVSSASVPIKELSSLSPVSLQDNDVDSFRCTFRKPQIVNDSL